MSAMHTSASPQQPLPSEMADALSELLALARAAGPAEVNEVQDALARAVALLGSSAVDCRRDGPVTGGLAPWQVRRATTLIDADLVARRSTADLARTVGLSPNHFARAFKASLGIPPHAFVVERRLTRARELILSTSEPLSEIALACGLADQAHLSRLFRRRFGCSPALWRRLHRALPERLAGRDPGGDRLGGDRADGDAALRHHLKAAA